MPRWSLPVVACLTIAFSSGIAFGLKPDGAGATQSTLVQSLYRQRSGIVFAAAMTTSDFPSGPISSGTFPALQRSAAKPEVTAGPAPKMSPPPASPISASPISAPAVAAVVVPAPATSSDPAPSANQMLRFAGSNTIGAELAPALVKGFLASRGATNVATSKIAAEEIVISAQLDGRSIEVSLAAHGSSTGFAALGQKAADIANASRPISEKEEAQLQSAGVDHDAGSEFVIGQDGIAIIVNRGNPVTTLTIDQLGRLFSGQAKWQDVGGPASCQDVGIYARDRNSGTWELFDLNVLHAGKTPLALSPAALRFEDSQLLSDRVAIDPCGIGFLGLPYVAGNRLLSVEAIGRAYLPTLYTIRTGIYPLSRRLYMYTPKFSTNIEVSRFLKFAGSPAGQRVVQDIGFISNDIKPPAAADVPAQARVYQKLFSAANPHQPLSTIIKFQIGGNTLDAKAQADLGAIEQYFRQNNLPGKSIVLIGHADSSGPHAVNCDLSLRRAELVQKEFLKLGLTASDVKGFCDDVPLASNETEAGRQQNRRVEIWIPARF